MARPILPELHQLLFEDLLRNALLEDLGRAGDVTTDVFGNPLCTEYDC